MEEQFEIAFKASARATGMLVTMLVRRRMILNQLRAAHKLLTHATSDLASLVVAAEKFEADKKEKADGKEILS